MRVLIAEDEPRVGDAVARGLRREGMAVDLARDGASALRKALAAPYDVVVLDRDLPELHGDEVCRTLAGRRPETKVLMLTAAGGVDDLVGGLALGADDYLPKPFRFAELVARTPRARPSQRRAPPARAHRGRRRARPCAPHGHARRPPDRPRPQGARRAGGADVGPGAVVGPDELLERAWDEGTDPFTNTVRMTVMTLRRKLGDPPVVHTVRGAGYRV